WDPSLANVLPQYMKIVYKVFYETVDENARDTKKTQGRDMHDYIRKAWEVYIDSMMREAEWINVGYIPTLREYLDNGKVSSGIRITVLPSILLLDALLTEKVLSEIDYPSRFEELLGLTFRLRGDLKTFK
ncbi:hypothetical protein KI387_029321, partial [Taxus chinensis]